MQSSHQIKKVHEYDIGERVYEGDYYAGRVLSVAMHDGVMGYVLLVNDRDEYTIYRGLSDANCSLIITRNIPEPVAIQFAQAILGGEPLPPPEAPVKRKALPKSPVKSEKPSDDSVDITSPYFDFV